MIRLICFFRYQRWYYSHASLYIRCILPMVILTHCHALAVFYRWLQLFVRISHWFATSFQRGITRYLRGYRFCFEAYVLVSNTPNTVTVYLRSRPPYRKIQARRTFIGFERDGLYFVFLTLPLSSVRMLHFSGSVECFWSEWISKEI